MKLLFCTDGSDISLTSLYNASKFIKDATVDIICVIDWSFLPESMSIDEANYSKVYENIADSVLIFAENAVKEKGLVVGDKIKSFGSPVEGILEQLEKEKYDLILLGSHGKKGIQKWLGSVSRHVISNITVPTFISRKKTKNKKVLFTTDGSEHSYHAIKESIELFDLKDKELYIVSVKENPELLPIEASLDVNWIETIDKQQRIHAAKSINKVKSILEKAELRIHTEIILTGSPAQKIIEFVEKEEVDLIIMGARSKVNLSTFLLGSVSKRVLENVHSGVVIIKN